ncbi:hypothetical protein AB0M34_12630 [Nocardia sp. NPDC050193]
MAAAAVLELVGLPDPPLRAIIGSGAPQMVAMALDQRRVDYSRDPESGHCARWPARSWPAGRSRRSTPIGVDLRDESND